MEQTTILAELEREGFVVISIRGISMQPLLYTNASHVLIRRLEGRPKKNDVVLYVRPDGEQVLHRVIGFDGDVCLIRGDNTFGLERVPLDCVKGVMESLWRGKSRKKKIYKAGDESCRKKKIYKAEDESCRKEKIYKAEDESCRKEKIYKAEDESNRKTKSHREKIGPRRAEQEAGVEDRSPGMGHGLRSRDDGAEREVLTTDFSYRLYVRFWNAVYPFRWMKYSIKHRLGCIVSRMGRRLFGDTSLTWVMRMAKDFLPGILLMTLCTGTVSVLSVGSALVMRETVDAAVALDRDAFLRWVGVFLGVMVGTIALNAGIRQMDEQITAKLENRIKVHTYQMILRSRYSSLKTFHTGELQNRMTSDVRIVADNAADLIPDLVSMMVQLVCALAVLMALDWRFASIFLVGGLMMLGVTFLFRRKMKGLHKEVQESDGRLRAWMQESVENLLIVKSFQAEEMAADRTRERAREHKDARMRRRTFSNVCNIGFGAVMQGSYLFGLVWCCFGILNGTLTYGTLTAVLQLVNQIRGPFANISGFVPQYYSMLASAERLIELEKLPADEKAKETPPQFQSIHARNLTFAYEDGAEEVIHDASFDIQKGELVALTGVSGIGKSTLLKLLLGIYRPTSGRLYAKTGSSGESEPQYAKTGSSGESESQYAKTGNSGESEPQYAKTGSSGEPEPQYAGTGNSERLVKNGMKTGVQIDTGRKKQCEMTEIDIDASTRGWFAYVPQGNMLMSGSIYEAVDFLHAAPYTKAQMEQVEEACQIACADEFIRDLPEGYHTILGEKGAGLSEGQMQRIAIARAIYRRTPILLLDEATSALDEATEHQLLQNLKSLGDQTVMIVTHRPAALEICEKRLVFDRSRIVMKKM